MKNHRGNLISVGSVEILNTGNLFDPEISDSLVTMELKNNGNTLNSGGDIVEISDKDGNFLLNIECHNDGKIVIYRGNGFYVSDHKSGIMEVYLK